jgi:hypothetical protein
VREPLSLLACKERVEPGLHGNSGRRRVGRIGVHQPGLLSARSQAQVRALTRKKAPVVSTVPKIHFGQWQRL